MSRQITTKFSTKFKSKNIIFSASTRFKIQTLFCDQRKLLQISVTKFKTTDVILMHLEILLYKHKAVIKVPEVVTQTVNRK